MKKSLLLLAVLGVAAAALLATAPRVLAKTVPVSVFSPGDREIGAFDAGHPIYVEVFDALPAAGTVTLYRVSGNATNTVVSFALTAGAYTGEVAAVTYFLRGDTLRQGGSVTSSTTRVFFDAD